MHIPYMDCKEAIDHLLEVDPRFNHLIKINGPPKLQRTRNSFKSLVQIVINQQLSGKAAASIYNRFVDLFPASRFPTPNKVRQLSISQIQTAGLSLQKATTIHELAEQYIQGQISQHKFRRMDPDEITEILINVKGIGDWTASIFLMFALNHPDILPVGDLGIRKGIQKLCGFDKLPNAKTMLQIAEPWTPFRTTASWYLWRLLETKPKQTDAYDTD